MKECIDKNEVLQAQLQNKKKYKSLMSEVVKNLNQKGFQMPSILIKCFKRK